MPWRFLRLSTFCGVSSRVSLDFFTSWQKWDIKDELIRMSILCAGTLSLWGKYVNGFFHSERLCMVYPRRFGKHSRTIRISSGNSHCFFLGLNSLLDGLIEPRTRTATLQGGKQTLPQAWRFRSPALPSQ